MTALARPAWLPDHVPFAGDWDAFVRTLYAIFESDFKHGRPRFQARPIWHDQCINRADSYRFEEAFWHLVTRDQWLYNPKTRRKEKERLPELDRAARLPWAKPITDNAATKEVLVWEFEDETRSGKIARTYLWLQEFHYVVILERQPKSKGDIFMLITSFYVDVPAKRKDLESRYERRLK